MFMVCRFCHLSSFTGLIRLSCRVCSVSSNYFITFRKSLHICVGELWQSRYMMSMGTASVLTYQDDNASYFWTMAEWLNCVFGDVNVARLNWIELMTYYCILCTCYWQKNYIDMPHVSSVTSWTSYNWNTKLKSWCRNMKCYSICL